MFEELLPETTLPVATGPQVRAHLRTLLRRHRRGFLTALGLHCAAAVAGLVAPRLLGAIVESVQAGTTTAHIDVLAGTLAAALGVQTPLNRAARAPAFVLREPVVAATRGGFAGPALAPSPRGV